MHSYTAQYAITASGKQFPQAFICLHDRSGAFGQVREKMETLPQKLGNAHVMATKSGKLQKETYEHFLNSVTHPSIKKNKFLLSIDSWGEQTNPAIYNKKFSEENDEPTCTLKIIPPKCTLLCQPCDVYFYRQFKNYTGKFQNCPVLTAPNANCLVAKTT
jgi:hypothetical protein